VAAPEVPGCHWRSAPRFPGRAGSVNAISAALSLSPLCPAVRYNPTMAHRIFLLSPADCFGRRAGYLLREHASLPLAIRLANEGAPLGEVFSFLSGLYFRGKLAYATAFSTPPAELPGALVITSNAGLMPATKIVHLDTLRDFARGEIELTNPGYRRPLERDATRIAAEAGEDCEMVLLGSLATSKYLDVLSAVFGTRLHFPAEFVGRGDMSRGALMLRCVQDRRELQYVRATGKIQSRARTARREYKRALE
jgi:hypothetical protein